MPDIVANGVRLRYELTGAEGPVIVLLNGIAMSIGHWKPFIEAMKGKYRVLCHDFRGQTLSEKPEGDYSLEQHAEDLSALLDALAIPVAHIVGTSYGSEVAMAFAIAYPERCATLTVIDGVSELDPVLKAAAESWMAAALCDARVFYKTLTPWTYSSAYIAANAAVLARREDSVASLPREWFEGFASLCGAFLKIDLTGKLNRITCPSFVLVGEFDILKHPGFAKIIHESISGSVLEILPGAGHAAVIEQPGPCAARFESFLEGARI
jgi:3-oxoadipate enol-lactonase